MIQGGGNMKRIIVSNIFEYIKLLKYFESYHYLWADGTNIFDCSDDLKFPLEIQEYRTKRRITKDFNPVPELCYTVTEFLTAVGADKQFDSSYGVGDLVIYKHRNMLYVGVICTISSSINGENFYNIRVNSAGIHYKVSATDIITELDDSLKLLCHVAVGV